MIEERHRVKHDPSIPPAEKKRLDLFLKITANATAYGSLARFDRREEVDPVPFTVYGPGADGFPDRTRYPEDPGPYCFPPVAASITAAARLVLALVERALHDMGGAYAFMDTDSIAIVATADGGQVSCPSATGDYVTALSHDQVRELLARFATLNPYGPDVVNDDPLLGRSPWKVEHASLDREVWCYAIASKRYALYQDTGNGPQLIEAIDDHEESGAADEAAPEAADGAFVDWSEHGLGMYLDPSDAATEQTARDETGRRVWIRDAWQWILTRALIDPGAEPPSWADRYAVSQFTVSTPRHANWFRLPKVGSQESGKPRPFGFGLLGHVDPFAAPLVTANPAAPYSRDPRAWPCLTWYDRHDLEGEPLRVHSADQLGDDAQQLVAALASGDAPLRTIGNVLRTYDQRPEHKSLASDGQTAGPLTRGQLGRRPVRSAPEMTALIGKEGNKLLERAAGEETDVDGYRNTYTDPDIDHWTVLTRPVLQDIRDFDGNTKRIAAAVGVSDRQVRNWFNGADIPHPSNRQRAEQFAVDWATEQLRAAGKPVPSHPAAVMYAYLKRCNEMT